MPPGQRLLRAVLRVRHPRDSAHLGEVQRCGGGPREMPPVGFAWFGWAVWMGTPGFCRGNNVLSDPLEVLDV